MKDYTQYDGMGLAELVRKKQVKASELLGAAQARCDAVNDTINAVVMRHDALADAAAKALDAEPGNAPFAGVPFLLKDLYMTLAGTTTTQGSRVFANTPPAQSDTTLTQCYKEAGFVIFGKTNSPELGMTGVTEPQLYGPTRNPWNTQYTPGGSSGGAAAAVAAGIVPLAHASDGGGSIRIPASCCGLIGLKPSRGRISAGPVRSEGWAGMSISHVVSRTVRDCAQALDISLTPASGEPYVAPAPQRPYIKEVDAKTEKLRIAICATRPDGQPLHDDCAQSLKIAHKLLTDCGHHVEEAVFDFGYEEMRTHQANIISSNLAALFELAKQTNMPIAPDKLETMTELSRKRGETMRASDYVNSVNYIHAMGRKMAEFLTDYDLYLTPTLGTPPVRIGHIDVMDTDIARQTARWIAFCPYTGVANMTGQPAISLPVHHNGDNLPIGVMFWGRYGADDVLLRLAAQLEKAAQWQTLAPIAA